MWELAVSHQARPKTAQAGKEESIMTGMLVSLAVICLILGVFYVAMCTSRDSAPNRALGLAASYVTGALRAVGLGCLIDFAAAAWDYMFNQRNPLLQIMYLMLVCGGYGVGYFQVFPEIPNAYLSEWPGAISICLPACLLACLSACLPACLFCLPAYSACLFCLPAYQKNHTQTGWLFLCSHTE